MSTAMGCIHLGCLAEMMSIVVLVKFWNCYITFMIQMNTLWPVNDVTEGSTQWFEFPFYLLSLVEYDGCFLGASYYVLATAEGSTHHYLFMTWNSHQIGNFSRKQTWVLPGCFLLWHHQRVIVYGVTCRISLRSTYACCERGLIFRKYDCFQLNFILYHMQILFHCLFAWMDN